MLLTMFAVPLGALLAAPPLNLWPLAFVMLVPLLKMARNQQVALWRLLITAAGVGVLFAVIGGHAIFVDVDRPWLHDLSQTTLWLLTLGVASVLGGTFAVCWMIGAWVTRQLSRVESLSTIILGSAIWVALTMLVQLIVSVFGAPMTFAYTVPAASPFGQVASLGGVWLVSFGIVLVNWLWACSVTVERPWLPPKSVLVTLLVWAIIGSGSWLWSANQSRHVESVRAVAIQRHRTDKLDYGDPFAYDQQLLEVEDVASQRTLVVLPEVSYAVDTDGIQRMVLRPSQLTYRSVNELAATNQQKLRPDTTIVAGFVDTTDQEAWKNGATSTTRDGVSSATYKRQLMPLGEYLPFRSSWPNQLQAQYRYVPPTQFGLLPSSLGPLATLFCNELFSSRYARVDVRAGATVITGLSSDFDVATPVFSRWQIRAASYRAVETGRAVVLAADQAQSAILRPTGSAVVVAPYRDTGRIEGIIPLRTDLTPWVRFAPQWGVVLALLVVSGTLLAVRGLREK